MSPAAILVARWASPSSSKAIALNCLLSTRWSTILQCWNTTISLHQFHSPILRRAEDGCRSCILRIISFFATTQLDGLSAKPKAILKNWPSRVHTATFGRMLATGAARRAKLTHRHWAWTTGYGHRIKSIGTFSVTCNSSTIISDAILGTQRSPSMPQSKR